MKTSLVLDALEAVRRDRAGRLDDGRALAAADVADAGQTPVAEFWNPKVPSCFAGRY
jgi:hypothetical protein